MIKNLPASLEGKRNSSSIPGLGRLIPSRRKWQPTPVFMPGKFHGQRSLAGYSPWGRGQTHTEHTCVTKYIGTGVSLMCQISKWGRDVK